MVVSQARVSVVRTHLYSYFSPWNFAMFFFVPMMIVYLMIPPTTFEVAYHSKKAWTVASVTFFLISISAFAVLSFFGSRLALFVQRIHGHKTESRVEHPLNWLRILLNLSLIVSVFAYGYWFFLGVLRSGSPTGLFLTYLRDPFYVKGVILKTAPGITTLTQLAVAAFPLSLAFMVTKSRLNLSLIVLVIILALVRSIIFSERLALIELVVPGAFVLFGHVRVRFIRFLTISMALIFFVFTFFSAAELRRSFVYNVDQPVLENAITRFVGYYVTSINNGQVLYEKYRFAKPMNTSFEIFWKFPGQSGQYFQIFPESRNFPDDWLKRNGLNEEFNTGTLFGELAVDFGHFGILVSGLIGYFSGFIFQLSSTSGFWRALYGIWLVGLSESMRIYYFANTRLFPAYVLLIIVFVLRSLRKPREMSQ